MFEEPLDKRPAEALIRRWRLRPLWSCGIRTTYSIPWLCSSRRIADHPAIGATTRPMLKCERSWESSATNAFASSQVYKGSNWQDLVLMDTTNTYFHGETRGRLAQYGKSR